MKIGPPESSASLGLALLVSNDRDAIGQLVECMKQLAIAVEVCTDVGIALRMLNRQKFEAVVVDLQLGEPTSAVLECLRRSPSNQTVVTFAITDNTSSAFRFSSKASFVMKRPLTMDSIGRILKVAYGLIVRERRRYFRCPVLIPAICKSDMKQFHCQAVNISEGGLAIMTRVRLRPGTHIAVQFTLPGQVTEFAAQSEICWYDERARAGLRFLSLSRHQQSELQEWLSQKLEESLPETVASKFRRTVDP
jgi:uncharacterized protein (TIGR02266 family)